MDTGKRIAMAREILIWNAIPLVLVGGLVSLSFGFTGVFIFNAGTAILVFGVFTLVVAKRLERLDRHFKAFAILWSCSIGITAIAILMFVVDEPKSLLSVTAVVLLCQVFCAVAVLFLVATTKSIRDCS